ncbi:MAG: penicillin-binding protein 1C, partial [Methylobacterium sp.]
AALPPPLRRLAHDEAQEGSPALRIAYPPDGARVDLGFAAQGGKAGEGVILKASGGVPPLTWMIDGMPVDRTVRRQSTWVPEGAGFARISVLDANGATDSVAVRIE